MTRKYDNDKETYQRIIKTLIKILDPLIHRTIIQGQSTLQYLIKSEHNSSHVLYRALECTLISELVINIIIHQK